MPTPKDEEIDKLTKKKVYYILDDLLLFPSHIDVAYENVMVLIEKAREEAYQEGWSQAEGLESPTTTYQLEQAKQEERKRLCEELEKMKDGGIGINRSRKNFNNFLDNIIFRIRKDDDVNS